MKTLLVPDKKIIEAELARRHHLDFMRMMWQLPDPLIVGQHTEAICEIIDNAITDYQNGKSSYLAIKCCHRHGKSDMVSRYLPANFIGKYPHKSIIVAGYGYSLTRTFSKFCRGLMDDPIYQYIYPGVKVDPKQRALDNWGVGKFGSTHWIGVGGSITGKTGDLIVLDDFFKSRKEAESEVYRDTVWESVADDIFTRHSPVAIVIILATPWHVDDVFGRIEKKQKENPLFPKFKEVKFPAFDERYKGGVLFPERFPMTWYNAERAFLGPYSSAGLMQCEPIARGGNMFEVDKIKFYDNPPEGLRWARGWDLASTEEERVAEDPDYTEGVKVGVRWITLQDGSNLPEIYIDDIIEGRWAAPTRDKMIKSAAIGDGTGVEIGVEAFGPYKDAYENIKKALHGVRKVKKLQLPGDKVSKASVLEAPMSAGNVYVRRAKWNERFLKQFREFPGAAHDDIVDGTVVAFETINPFEKRVWPQFQGRHMINLNIDWDHVKSDEEGTLHYAGIWQKEDLSIWVVLMLWDVYKGFLFIYDAFTCDESIPSVVIPMLIKRMRLRTHKCEAIMCNDLMWEDKGYSKNIGIQYRKEIAKYRIDAKIKESFNYDEYGTIVEMGQLFDNDMVYVEEKSKSLILQLMGWITVDRGKHTGSRPNNEDDGFCRAICLVVSELKKKTKWTDVVPPILTDYAKSQIVQSAYGNLAK